MSGETDDKMVSLLVGSQKTFKPVLVEERGREVGLGIEVYCEDAPAQASSHVR